MLYKVWFGNIYPDYTFSVYMKDKKSFEAKPASVLFIRCIVGGMGYVWQLKELEYFLEAIFSKVIALYLCFC